MSRQVLVLGQSHSVTGILTNSSTELFVLEGQHEQEALEAFVADKIARALVMRGDFDSVQDAMEEAKSRFVVRQVTEATKASAEEIGRSTHWHFFVDDDDFAEYYEAEVKRAQEYYAQHGWVWEVPGRHDKHTLVLSDLLGKWLIMGAYDNSIPWDAVEELEQIAEYRIHLG